MLKHKIMWISTTLATQTEEAIEALSDFSTGYHTGVVGARSLMVRENLDCIVVCDSIPDADRVEYLEDLRSISPRVPFIFWGPNVGADVAVRLVRAGASYCLGLRDGIDVL